MGRKRVWASIFDIGKPAWKQPKPKKYFADTNGKLEEFFFFRVGQIGGGTHPPPGSPKLGFPYLSNLDKLCKRGVSLIKYN